MGVGKKGGRKPDDIRCEFCGSSDLKEDYEVGEVVCNDCGLVESGKLLDPAGHSRFGEDAHNSKSSELGSSIGKGRGPRSIRRAARKIKPKKSYLQQLYSLVDEVVPEGRIRDSVKDLLKRYDEDEKKLWRLRGKLRGDGTPVYRQKTLVVGAIASLNIAFIPNEAGKIKERWGIDHIDFVKSRKRFRNYIASNFGPTDREGVRNQRRREILHNLGRIRDILAESVGWDMASAVYEEAIEELKEHFEPMTDDQEDPMGAIQNTKYGTKSSETAAWEATLVAMIELGVAGSMRWLERRVAPTSGGNLTSRYIRRAAALADGSEEE